MSSMQLMDLNIDILLMIFRDFVPLKDKLKLLPSMPEWHNILTYRGAYLSSPTPFSLEYLQFLCGLQPGWYVARSTMIHWLFLQIDQKTLHVELYHFFLEGFDSASTDQQFFRGSIHRISRNLGNFLSRYEYVESNTTSTPPLTRMLIYRVYGQGLILIDLHSVKHGWYKMRFYDGCIWRIRLGERRKLPLRWHNEYHLEIHWKMNHQLILHCLFPVQIYCGCISRLVNLFPITFEASPDLKILNWSEGSEGDSVSLATLQKFQLAEDEEHIESDIIFYLDKKETYPPRSCNRYLQHSPLRRAMSAMQTVNSAIRIPNG